MRSPGVWAWCSGLENLFQQIEAAIAIQRGVIAATTLLGILTKVPLPHIGGVLTFASMRGNTGAYAADNWRIDAGSGHNNLSFGERGQVVQQIATNAFDGGGHAFLVNLVDDAHNTLGLTLAEHVGIQFAGALADQTHADTEFAPLRQHLFQDSGRDNFGAAGGEMVRLLQ